MTSPSEAVRVGAITVTPLLDGMFPIGFDLMPQADCERGHELFALAGKASSGPSYEPVYAFLVEANGRRILIDSGCGQIFGPALGGVPEKLAAIGVAPFQIDTVVLTHMHPDHIGGLLLPDGKPRFPVAELVTTEAEAEYWLDDRVRDAAPDAFRPFFDAAVAVLDAYRDRIRLVDDRDRICGGLSCVSLPGHTPGHVGILIEDDEERLLIWGDVIHCATLQLAQPEWPIAFDVDAAGAAATRANLFKRVADDSLRVLGMHLEGAGYLKRDGHGYVFDAGIT